MQSFIFAGIHPGALAHGTGTHQQGHARTLLKRLALRRLQASLRPWQDGREYATKVLVHLPGGVGVFRPAVQLRVPSAHLDGLSNLAHPTRHQTTTSFSRFSSYVG
jgi:hypothetical protein